MKFHYIGDEGILIYECDKAILTIDLTFLSLESDKFDIKTKVKTKVKAANFIFYYSLILDYTRNRFISTQ